MNRLRFPSWTTSEIGEAVSDIRVDLSGIGHGGHSSFLLSLIPRLIDAAAKKFRPTVEALHKKIENPAIA
ncbi:hypothetical protein HFC70_13295 [Agrobacterium sp. a22-2]|uniref:hypothetical protein n=1 Tax=Agrobacterium sp. a22-2 TaxID=2283840 RepID=UPI001447526D|nr:hypothetical protein [Agrobacterium sp. a22-2]NKN37331.1 hypothetical protein [Agrobacterium sp. a22-2]